MLNLEDLVCGGVAVVGLKFEDIHTVLVETSLELRTTILP